LHPGASQIALFVDERHSSDMAIQPNGSALWVTGSPERSFGRLLKIQRKRERMLQSLHYIRGKPADLAVEAHSW
jgi:hypothetical protein